MMGEFSSEEPGPKDTSPLIDLTGVSLDDMARIDESVLTHSINRVLGDIANPDKVVHPSFSATA
jgi:FXSXX-COOH protein